MSTDETMEARYERAMHRGQSAIAFLLSLGSDMANPKHLRVGLNGAMADHGSLVRLLVQKGVITHDEYMTALVEGTEKEADDVVARARRESGNPHLDFA